MHSNVPDVSDSEPWAIETTLGERYGEPREVQLAESELRRDTHSPELTSCPRVYWEHDDYHFVVCNSDDRRCRPQFFNRLYQACGTGVDEFDDITECTVSLLQVRADHESQRKDEAPGNP